MKTFVAATAVAFVLAAGSTSAQTQTTPATVIHAGRLLDKPGQPPRGPSTLVVRAGKIESVRDGLLSPDQAGAPGARVVDLSQRFVMPGLIDTHVHVFRDDDKLRQQLQASRRDVEDWAYIGQDNMRRTLEVGFTTVRDLNGDPRSVTALRDAIEQGLVAGPTVLTVGRAISISAGHQDGSAGLNRDRETAAKLVGDNVCDGPEECRKAVRRQIANGADAIKFAATGGVGSDIAAGLEQQMFDDEMAAIVQTAALLGRKTSAHAHGAGGVKAALRAGVHSIEHGTFVDDEALALFKKTGAYLVPTMLAPRAALETARSTGRAASAAKAEETLKVARTNWARAIKGGVKIAFGTDNGVGAHGTQPKEFQLMVEAGMTPAEAIKAATVHAADLLGRADRIGTLEPGKDADVIAVAGDPLADVKVLERVDFVMRRGVVHKQDGRRQPFPPN